MMRALTIAIVIARETASLAAISAFVAMIAVWAGVLGGTF